MLALHCAAAATVECGFVSIALALVGDFLGRDLALLAFIIGDQCAEVGEPLLFGITISHGVGDPRADRVGIAESNGPCTARLGASSRSSRRAEPCRAEPLGFPP